VAEQFHQRIDAHVRVRELGGLGMAQSVHERTGDGLRVGAGAFEGPFDGGLHCSPGDAFAVAANEQRGSPVPSR